MASDRDQALKAAEKLLKGGKQPAALAHFRKLSASFPEDLALHNRIGDILCLNGLGPEAVPYYEKVAFAYRDSGFIPKAVAMFKKILRQQPDSFETMVELGGLYLRQRLPGEARNYLLHAADQYVQNSGYQRAGEIYRMLIDAEPQVSGHRVRLAETLAAAGENDAASRELLATAGSLGEGEAEDRLKLLHRAAELAPDSPEPVLAIVSCLADAGRSDEALRFLDETLAGRDPVPELQNARLSLVLSAGSPDDALEELLAGDGDGAAFIQVLESYRAGPGEDRFWQRFDAWREADGGDRGLSVLEAIAAAGKGGNVQALTRLDRVLDGGEDRLQQAEVLERLITCLHGDDRSDEATRFEDRLRELKPDSAVLNGNAGSAGPADPGASEGAASVGAPAPGPDEAEDARSAFPELEAPAVPLNKADEEFASGRLTQAEILEKYGLEDKALEQVREVVERFPGHVAGQTKLVELLKPAGDKAGLRDAWLGLAFAQRASGDMDAARRAVTLAEAVLEPDDRIRRALEAFRLAGDVEEVEAPPVSDPEPPAEPAAAAEPPEPEPDEAAGPVVQPGPEPEEDLDVVFDEEPEPEPEPEPVPDPEPESKDEPLEEEPEEGAANGEDLAALAAALEGELFLDDDEPLVPEAPREQSLDQVFAAFQEQVEQQVDSDDFQTHYDLGIAYREMGLLDEAITAFERTAKPGDFHRESCIMIASCHREAGRLPDAAQWYRKALEVPTEDEEAQSGLRYDLAEALAEIGEMEEALTLYRVVFELDPSFRDIAQRVSQLESRLDG